MKRVLFIFFFLAAGLLPVAIQAQGTELYLLRYDYVRRWRFGFSLGINVFDFTVINSMREVNLGTQQKGVLWADVVNPQAGFNINGIVDYRLSHYFNLRALPGICFGTRQLNFYNNDDGSLHHRMTLESNYVEVPILLKFSAKRVSNYRPYLVSGVNPRFNMNWKTAEQKGNYISSVVFEPFVEFGAGLDIYFYFFKLSLEFKYSGTFINNLGSSMVAGQEAYHDALSRLNSQLFIFAIHIE
ncbi:MAG: PorT family protein [Prevotellaceae bacterium]|jgi:hypothetical protein|nr:PorT family protein [Prevotellaceae bacterium]